MNKYKIVRFAALAVFIAAFCVWGYTKLLYMDADLSYGQLQQQVIREAEPKEQERDEIGEPMLEVNHKELYAQNPDYVCWLYACGGKISYPVVKGRNNSQYLHKTFFGDKSFVGSIFLDYRCALGDFHTVMYGHSMKDGTMFRSVVDYTDKKTAEQYPYIYVYTPEGREEYEIFSVMDIAADSIPTALGSPENEEKAALAVSLKQNSLYTLPGEPTTEDKILSLVTCSVRDESKRIAVSAYRTQN